MSYIVTRQLKSTGLAAFLAILFGGIGLFYSTILGGIVMTLIFPVLLVALFFLGKFLTLILLCCSYYFICLIWAIVGVNSYNKRIVQESSLFEQNQRGRVSSELAIFNKDNYYEEYRRSMRSDNTGICIVITIVIFALIFYAVYYFVGDTGLIPNSREKLR